MDYIKQGAADCVLKDRLARLPTAVRRALEEKQPAINVAGQKKNLLKR